MTPQDIQTALGFCDSATAHIDALRGNVAQVRSMLAVDLGNAGTPTPPVVPPVVVPPVVVPPVTPTPSPAPGKATNGMPLVFLGELALDGADNVRTLPGGSVGYARITIPDGFAGKKAFITVLAYPDSAWKIVHLSQTPGDLTRADGASQGLTATAMLAGLDNAKAGDVWYLMIDHSLPGFMPGLTGGLSVPMGRTTQFSIRPYPPK